MADSNSEPNDPALDRYAKQVRYAPLGEAGQRRLMDSTVLVVGCGALGSVSASTLVRAGVGRVRIVDRDYLELSNLQRQVLFDEADIASGLPKAAIAETKLRQVNSQVAVEGIVADITHENLRQLAAGVDVIVDGTDNFETRLLINDFSVSENVPWIYGGCVGAEGQVLPVLPGETACFSALVAEPPAPGSSPTCDTAGILGPAVNLVASLQVTEAIKILSGQPEAVSRRLTVFDLWHNRIRQMQVEPLHAEGSCPTCHERQFPWLEGRRGGEAVVLCGRNSVQLRAAATGPVELETLAKRLAEVGQVVSNPFLVRLSVEQYRITLFADGRAIVSGTEDEAEARSAYARFVGA